MRLAIALALAVSACGPSERGFQADFVEAEPGSPIPGLGDAEAARFAVGQALFNRPFTPEEGLGPLFNQAQCSSCHDLPSSGGHGAEPVTKASHFTEATGCDILEAEGGDLFQQIVTPAAREAGLNPESVPTSASAVTLVVPPALYGLGLVERVPMEDLLGAADPEDANRDGISGRTGVGPEGLPGRFGFKAQHSSLAGFVEGAVRMEMGLTTPMHPEEERPGGHPLPPGLDPAADPEVDGAFLASLTDYVLFLAPPTRRPVPPEERAAVREGERTFEALGCTSCHTPVLTTGPSESPALDRKAFRVYSDLLLHDLGPDLADICAPGATPSEWRTARLVGLGLRSEFMHNGRAQRLDDAIRLHGGEGSSARDAYAALSDGERQDLLRFLQTL